MSRKLELCIIVIIVLMCGCTPAYTRITSFPDPDFKGKKYQKIMVVVPFADLAQRDDAESVFVEHFNKYSVHGTPAIKVVLPTRTYSNEELSKIMTDQGFDGVLIVTLTDYYEKQVYIPSSSYTSGQATASNNSINFTANTYTSGGYSISKPRVKYELKLYDVNSGKIAWMASSFTRGNAYARFENIIDSVARTAIEALDEDGFLPETNNK